MSGKSFKFFLVLEGPQDSGSKRFSTVVDMNPIGKFWRVEGWADWAVGRG